MMVGTKKKGKQKRGGMVGKLLNVEWMKHARVFVGGVHLHPP